MKTKIDGAGRLVIPKPLRDRYGLDEGSEVEIIAVPDGITLIPARPQRRIVRRGRVVAIDTGTGTASADEFDVDGARRDRLDRLEGAAE